MSRTVLESWTEVGAWIHFFNGQTGVRILLAIGQRTVFLEQRWGLEGEGLLNARPHTNVRYSNEQSGPSEYYPCSQRGRPTTCDTVRVHGFLVRNVLVSVGRRCRFEEARYDERRAPLAPAFHS